MSMGCWKIKTLTIRLQRKIQRIKKKKVCIASQTVTDCMKKTKAGIREWAKKGCYFLWMFMLRLENLKNKVTFPWTYQMKCVPGRENSSAKRGTSSSKMFSMGKVMGRRESEQRWCHRMLRSKVASLLLLKHQISRSLLYTLCIFRTSGNCCKVGL